MDAVERQNLGQARRIVVKVGTAVLTRPDGRLALARMAHLVEQIGDLLQEGRQVLLVSSGAVGIGVERLGLPDTPTRLVERQACAAVGQGALVSTYNDLLERLGHVGAQVLLTEDDFSDRGRYVNLQHTLERLLSLGVLPILNENDTVSTAEIEMTDGAVFGDNDRLSALLASRMEADLLVVLSDVEGVYTQPPGAEGAEVVGVFSPNTEVVLGAGSARGRGGMQSKIEAARVANLAGVAVVVASGVETNTLRRVAQGECVGTFFPPDRQSNSRKRWLRFATTARGRLVVNSGARQALEDRKASLLPSGVVAVEGEWSAGEVVGIADETGADFARGMANCSSTDARSSMGCHSTELGSTRGDRCLVHSENLAILQEVVS
ncbi:MAG: glutamate 5-kinase [Myxococcota bacterium]|nr:glutamate 5-kinase [Myxococcota bacterium]